MNLRAWIARREPYWQRLDALLARVEKSGLRSLAANEIHELASLYRTVSADLARARTQQAGARLVRDLQRLATRGYSLIYQGSRPQDWKAVWEFVLWGFPAAIRESWVCITLATATFLLLFAIGWWYGWQDAEFLSLVLPEQMISLVRDDGELWFGRILTIGEPLASTQIAINNIVVSFNTIAGGLLAGTRTVYIMAYNGLLIGTVGALVGRYDLAYPFWAFVSPHGALELPAIFIAGGAGLEIARGLLLPGRLRRLDALKYRGRQVARLTFGVVGLLVVAGLIEGFFSPNPSIPDELKYLVGLGLLSALLAYCSRSRSRTL